MKYILVWWIINSGHPQALHFEKYPDATSCEARANDLLAAGARARCSRI